MITSVEPAMNSTTEKGGTVVGSVGARLDGLVEIVGAGLGGPDPGSDSGSEVRHVRDHWLVRAGWKLIAVQDVPVGPRAGRLTRGHHLLRLRTVLSVGSGIDPCSIDPTSLIVALEIGLGAPRR